LIGAGIGLFLYGEQYFYKIVYPTPPPYLTYGMIVGIISLAVQLVGIAVFLTASERECAQP
jgi:hypothetical protein